MIAPMNYLHHYHAGNFADVFKHLVLLELVTAMQQKDTPLALMDTHAGAGLYDLTATPSQKTGEWREGIGRLMSSRDAHWQPLLQAVAEWNEHPDRLDYYPGSPMLLANHLRLQDSLTLCELSDGPMRHLRNHFGGERRIHIHQRDGFEALSALLPPKGAKRALVLIDPPYEKDDFGRLLNELPKALQRFRQGVFAIWYPIKTRAGVLPFTKKLQALAGEDEKFLNLSIMVGPENSLRMNGCGMAIINPPFAAVKRLKALTPKLEKALQQTPSAG